MCYVGALGAVTDSGLSQMSLSGDGCSVAPSIFDERDRDRDIAGDRDRDRDLASISASLTPLTRASELLPPLSQASHPSTPNAAMETLIDEDAVSATLSRV